jgi:hypothetical protein
LLLAEFGQTVAPAVPPSRHRAAAAAVAAVAVALRNVVHLICLALWQRVPVPERRWHPQQQPLQPQQLQAEDQEEERLLPTIIPRLSLQGQGKL